MAPQELLDLTKLDLTEDTSLFDERVAYDTDGVRALLSALQLKPVSGPMVDVAEGDVFDLAVYRATGDRRLATIFGTAA